MSAPDPIAGRVTTFAYITGWRIRSEILPLQWRQAAMKLTGHKTESVYRRYAIVSESDLTEAARRLDSVAGTVSGTIGPEVGRVVVIGAA